MSGKIVDEMSLYPQNKQILFASNSMFMMTLNRSYREPGSELVPLFFVDMGPGDGHHYSGKRHISDATVKIKK